MRLAFLVVVLLVWAVVVLARLYQTGEAPDPITWGIPGGLWVLLYPRKQPASEAAEAPTVPVQEEAT